MGKRKRKHSETVEEPVPEPEPELAQESEPEQEAELEAEPDAEQEAEQEVEQEDEQEAEPEVEPEAEPEVEPEVKPEVDAPSKEVKSKSDQFNNKRHTRKEKQVYSRVRVDPGKRYHTPQERESWGPNVKGKKFRKEKGKKKRGNTGGARIDGSVKSVRLDL